MVCTKCGEYKPHGLHVETNLQILVAAENRSKGARFEYGRS
jgi:hypothetical protein